MALKQKDIGGLRLKEVETLINGTNITSLLFEVIGNEGEGWKNLLLEFFVE